MSSSQTTRTRLDDELVEEAVSIFQKEIKSLDSYKDGWDAEKIVQECKKTSSRILRLESFHDKLVTSVNYFDLFTPIGLKFKEIVEEEAAKVKQRREEVEGKLEELQNHLCYAYKANLACDFSEEFVQGLKMHILKKFCDACSVVPIAIQEKKMRDFERRLDDLEKGMTGSGIESENIEESSGPSILVDESADGNEEDHSNTHDSSSPTLDEGTPGTSHEGLNDSRVTNSSVPAVVPKSRKNAEESAKANANSEVEDEMANNDVSLEHENGNDGKTGNDHDEDNEDEEPPVKKVTSRLASKKAKSESKSATNPKKRKTPVTKGNGTKKADSEKVNSGDKSVTNPKKRKTPVTKGNGTKKADSDEEDDKEYEVDCILNDRTNIDGSMQYLVKWKGYSKARPTWEPVHNLNCDEAIEMYWENLEKTKKTPALSLREGRDETERYVDVAGSREVSRSRKSYREGFDSDIDI